MRRSRRSRPRAQRRSRGAACPRDLLLHRRVYDLAEAADASEHCHRRRRRRSSAGNWLGGGYRNHRARTAHPVPDHLPVDPTALLGAVAHSYRRLRSCGRTYAARCWRERHNSVANSRPTACFWLPTSVLPCGLGFAGTIYGATAVVSGTVFIALAARLSRSRGTDRRAAHRLFVFSISYLFLLFAALLADHQIDRWSTTVAAFDARIDRTPHTRNAWLPGARRLRFHSVHRRGGLTCASTSASAP